MFSISQAKPKSNNKETVSTIKGWVNAAVDTTGAVVMVTELKCTEAGCPPFDTVMALLREGNTDKRVLHCMLTEVTEAEVRRVWSQPPQ